MKESMSPGQGSPALQRMGKSLPELSIQRHVFAYMLSGVLLLFQPQETRPGGSLPPHGAEGSIHVCFRVPPESYGTWQSRLRDHGVAILHEAAWGRGRSFYFQDPDGNLLEIADADIWPA